MSKGDKQRSNKEAKKPKAEKTKTPATANFSGGKSPVIAGKKIK